MSRFGNLWPVWWRRSRSLKSWTSKAGTNKTRNINLLKLYHIWERTWRNSLRSLRNRTSTSMNWSRNCNSSRTSYRHSVSPSTRENNLSGRTCWVNYFKRTLNKIKPWSSTGSVNATTPSMHNSKMDIGIMMSFRLRGICRLKCIHSWLIMKDSEVSIRNCRASTRL